MATLVTATGARFDTSKPARSNLAMVLDNKGRQVMDNLRITGKTTEVVEFMEKKTMIEVEGSLGCFEINEDFIWQ